MEKRRVLGRGHGTREGRGSTQRIPGMLRSDELEHNLGKWKNSQIVVKLQMILNVILRALSFKF